MRRSMITCRVKIIRFITKISVISVCFSDRVFVPSSTRCKWSRKSVIDVDLGIRETVNINKLDNSETTARKIIAGINIGGARDTEVRHAGREIVDIKYQLILRIRRKWFRLNVQLICSENRWCEFNISCVRDIDRVCRRPKRFEARPGREACTPQNINLQNTVRVSLLISDVDISCFLIACYGTSVHRRYSVILHER